jgi:hypothetical protein
VVPNRDLVETHPRRVSVSCHCVSSLCKTRSSCQSNKKVALLECDVLKLEHPQTRRFFVGTVHVVLGSRAEYNFISGVELLPTVPTQSDTVFDLERPPIISTPYPP